MTRRVARAAPDLPPAPHKAPLVGGKETSAEMASLAASYINTQPDDVPTGSAHQMRLFCEDVRRLAASVLSQTEPKS